ncbi:hypothetical protein [Conexibacter sp. SYSU D00693]|uniref:hypothetical protein n=1 Tax=Conexibacter sp. SYSU D00693 TaxID=2812560 RepID=UPI00196B8B26|nr:hypothetical protein [Conexibacter sp. SYSU D00693]
MPLASVVDWSALGQVALYALAGSLVLTWLFTTGVLAAQPGRDGAAPTAVRRAVSVVALGLCAAIVVLGVVVMLSSK